MINIEPIKKENCSGCKACGNVCPCDAIEFKNDEFGFFYPSVNEEKCIECGACNSVCDFQNDSISRNMPLNTYAAVNKDINVLKKSSSGGVFFALAEYVLEKDGAVCGCVYDEDLQPIHICTEKREDCVRMMGSKYVQSDVGYVYREVKERLNKGEFVLFTGTPCQVAALLSVLSGKEYSNLLTADVVCHGVPSVLMFKKYLEYLQKKYNTEIVGYNFRSKKYGWQRFTSEFINSKGKTKNIGKLNEFYQSAFTSGNIMRESCFNCKYASVKRVGDFTMGDFWGHEKVNISSKTKEGLSICTVNTQKAANIVPVLSQKLKLIEVDYDIIVKGNVCLRMPTPKGEKWNQYMTAIKEDKIGEIAKQYINKNRKKILRNNLKLRVPDFIFKAIRKNKYGKLK